MLDINDSYKCFHLNLEDINALPGYLSSVYIANCVLNSILAVVATVGNFAILVSILRNKHLHSPGNSLIACLALSDLSIGVLVQPSYVPYKIAELRKDFNTICHLRFLYNLSGFLFSILSCFTVTNISIDKFLTLHLHLRYKEIVTVKRVMISFATCVVMAIMMTTLLAWYQTVFLIGAIVIFFCLLLTLGANCCLLKRLTYHHRQIITLERSVNAQHSTADNAAQIQSAKFRKSVFTITYIVGFMVLCYFPYLAVFLYRMLSGYPSHPVRFALNITEMIAFLHSAWNPFMYCWNIREIRKSVMDTLHCR